LRTEVSVSGLPELPESRWGDLGGKPINDRKLGRRLREVFGVFGLLKVTSGRQPPATELITGSIPSAAPARKPPTEDAMAAFLSPASTQHTTLVQSTAVDRGPIPLPRRRPKRPCLPATAALL